MRTVYEIVAPKGLSTNTNFGAILVIALYLDGFLTGNLPF